jgi:Right handed beta helix region
MNTTRSFIIILCCALFFVGASSASWANAATLTVDDDHAQCPTAGFTSIQAAVNAASPGDKINVCPGTYHEQVKITKPLTIQGLEVANQNLATVMPTGVVANSSSLVTSNPIAAIILVDGASKVDISNLTIDGANNGLNACLPVLMGIYYRNASGTVDGVAVKNMRPGSCTDSGYGIFVQSGNGGKSKVDVLNSSVHDYQKNGITGNQAGTEVNFKGNAVSGIGSAPDVAQNGIQIAFGAKGTIDSNAVINHVYSQCTSTACDTNATNILVFQSDEVKVTKNTTGNSQVNIDYFQGNKGEISNNTIFQSLVFDGIDLVGDQNHASNNNIFNSEASGVYVLGNKNEVNGNTINEAPVGILEDSPSSGNKFSGNKFYNTGMNTTPPRAHAASVMQLRGRVSPAQP